jgi:hypothetical protein
MPRLNQKEKIAWDLRPLGQIYSQIINEGDGPQIIVWIKGGKDSDHKEIRASGATLDEALASLWKQLTSPGSYVMIGRYKHVYGRGVWQATLE